MTAGTSLFDERDTAVHLRAAGLRRCYGCGALVVNSDAAKDAHKVEHHGWLPDRPKVSRPKGTRSPWASWRRSA